jgi:GAF domain-containing protein
MSTIILGAGAAALAGLTICMFSYRKRLFEDDSAAWLKITIGVLFFDLLALTHFLAKLKIAEGMPFLSGEIAPVLVSTVCLAGGALFTAAGTAVWVPKLVHSNSRVRRLRTLADLVDNIRQICHSNSPTTQILAEVTSRVFREVGPKELIYMKWEGRRNLLAPVRRYPSDGVSATPMLSMIEEDDWLRDVILRSYPTRSVIDDDIDDSLDGIPFSLESGEMVVALPVAAKGNLLGVLAMAFPNERSFGSEDVAILQGGMNSLADAIDGADLRESYEQFAHLKDTHTRLMRIALECEGVADLLSTGIRQFKSFVPFDMLSVSVLDENATSMIRYSFMESGNRVQERGLSLPVHESAVEQIARARRGDINNRLTGIDYRDDAWLAKCGFGSRLSIPVFAESRVVGVVSYVSMGHARFNDDSLSRAELLSDIFAVAIRNALVRDRLTSWSNHIRDSWRLLARLVSCGNTEEFFSVFAKQVAASMPVTCCRVSLYDRDANSLRVIAEHSLRGDPKQRYSVSREMPLDRMPHHLSVIKSGKSLIMDNQTDSEDRTENEEIECAFPDKTRSAIISPLSIAGATRGVMSLGEARDPKRRPFGPDDLSFAEMRATQASLALAIEENRNRLKSSARMKNIEPIGAFVLDTLSDMNRKIAGPLSSIMGAAELLERNLPNAGGNTTNCVSTIKRNTNRVVKTLNTMKNLRDAV